MTRSKTSIELTSRRTTRALFGILGILVVLHLIVVVFHTVFHVRLEALTQLVDLDLEGNIPTFFNSALFFLGAGVFFLHGRSAATKERNGWYLMTFVFLFLGLDEGSQIHEKFLQFTFRLLQQGSEGGTDLGWFYYAWVIPYGLAALVLAAVLFRWFMKLEPQAVYVMRHPGAFAWQVIKGFRANQGLLLASANFLNCQLTMPM